MSRAFDWVGRAVPGMEAKLFPLSLEILLFDRTDRNLTTTGSVYFTSRNSIVVEKWTTMASKALALVFILTQAIFSTSFVPFNRIEKISTRFASNMDNICPDIPTTPADPSNEVAILASGWFWHPQRDFRRTVSNRTQDMVTILILNTNFYLKTLFCRRGLLT